MRSVPALLATVLLASTAFVGTPGWRIAFSLATGGDEDNHLVLAIARDTLAVAKSNTTSIDLFDARTGAPRATIACPRLTAEDAYDPSCTWSVAVSNKVVVGLRSDAIDVFRLNGTFLRRLPITADAIALRGTLLLVGQVDAADGVVRAAFVAIDSGRIVRRFVQPDSGNIQHFVNVAFAGTDAVIATPVRVSVFDGRTGVLRWTRTAPASFPTFGFGLATLGSDVIVGPGIFRFDGRTGDVRMVYVSPAGEDSSHFGEGLAASADMVLVVDSGPHPGGTAHLYDADSGQLLGKLALDASDNGEGIETAAFRGPYLALGSASYYGDGRVWMFAR
jgi:outer membrane protein assembly factor BamB